MRLLKEHRLVLMFFMLGVLYLLRIGTPTDSCAFGWDNSEYVVLAKSLATGQGLRMINEPDAPFSIFYPVGYPAVLSVILRFMPFEPLSEYMLRALCYLSCVACLIALYLSFRLFQHYVSYTLSVILTLLLGTSPELVTFAGSIWSECLFTMWVIGAVLLIKLTGDSSVKQSRKLYRFVIVCVSVCAGFSMLTRVAGVALIAGILIFFLVRDWKMAMLFLVVTGAVVSPFMLWKAMNVAQEGYLRWVWAHYAWQVPFRNVGRLLQYFSKLLFAPMSTSSGQLILERYHLSAAATMLAVLLGMVFCIGLFKLIQGKDAIAYVLLCYIAMVTFYPWEPDRFMLPVNALIVVSFIRGISDFIVRFASRVQTDSILAIVLTVCFSGSAMVNYSRIRNVYLYGDAGGEKQAKRWGEFKESLQWIKDNTTADSVIVTTLAAGTYLLTERKTIQARATVKQVAEAIAKANTTSSSLYLFAYDTITIDGQIRSESLDPLSEWLAVPENLNRVKLVWKSSCCNNVIYKIVR